MGLDATTHSDVFRSVVVRPIASQEKERWKALMAAHHYLGFDRIGGRSIFYVATLGEEWLALLSWSSAALHVGCREKWIGWNRPVREKRLQYIANNSRFLILPGIGVKNLASKILSTNIARLSADWRAFHGHSIWMVETFVDPSRYRGTCYLAANWERVGETRGFSRVPGKRGFYSPNHQPKIYLARELVRKCRERLADPRFEDKRRGEFKVVDIRQLPMDGGNGLIRTMSTIKDSRRRQGKVHSNTSVLSISACAMLSGARGFKAIAEWGQRLTPRQLRRLRCHKGKPPSESTVQRVLRSTDAQEFDNKVSNWLLKAAPGVSKGIAVDGKVIRGSYTGDGQPMQLLSALLHEEKIVISQRRIDSKENEITEFNDLLKGVDLAGQIVTADALHCQTKHAEFLVNQKGADFLFNVKDNQPSLKLLIEQALNDPLRKTASEATLTAKAHGRVDTRECIVKEWTFDLANQHAFPFIGQICRVRRTWYNLTGQEQGSETRYFITSLKPNEANAEAILRTILEHWAIENASHYVRDETMGEDKSRIRTGNAPYVMATLRNLSIGIIRISGEENIARGIRHFAWSHKAQSLRAIGV
jgi:predicted transposase YbfD/YdcC